MTTQQSIMNEVEASVKLPHSAGPLKAYARYYRYKTKHLIEAVFLIPYPPTDLGIGCSISDSHSAYRNCTAQDRIDLKKDFSPLAVLWIKAGDRRWVASIKDIPFVSDAGCGQVTIEYEILKKRFLDVRCAGRL